MCLEFRSIMLWKVDAVQVAGRGVGVAPKLEPKRIRRAGVPCTSHFADDLEAEYERLTHKPSHFSPRRRKWVRDPRNVSRSRTGNQIDLLEVATPPATSAVSERRWSTKSWRERRQQCNIGRPRHPHCGGCIVLLNASVRERLSKRFVDE